MTNNPIAFVSLGPGDTELITLKALHTLQQADVIFCPGTAKQSRAEAMLRTLGITKPIALYLLPMSKARDAVLKVYNDLAEKAMQHQRNGARVAIAVEGDAGIYASMHYVLEKLTQMDCHTLQIAGIPSFIGAGAVARLHLIQQQERLVVVPGDITEKEIDNYLATRHTIAIMKLSQCQDAVKQHMAKHPQVQYHYFENISTPQERYLSNQQEIAATAFPYFSIMIIK